ncbi:MAG: hypothetical protein E7589_07425 [Ruminococcaceae bacterium]|nr:hypothetical protein [Oscillospiraceae bacterium]
MYFDNVQLYVSNGYKKNKESYRKACIGPVLLGIMAGLVPGVILKSYWLYMSVTLLVVSLACMLIVFWGSSRDLSLTRRLCLDTVIYGAWVLNLSILELMYFMMWKRFTPWFLLVYLPVILVPLFSGIQIHKALKKSDYNSKKIVQSNVRTISFLSGILGMNFAAIFRNANQGVAFIVVLLCLSILNAFMSLGLLSLQKLYYIKKLNISW